MKRGSQKAIKPQKKQKGREGLPTQPNQTQPMRGRGEENPKKGGGNQNKHQRGKRRNPTRTTRNPDPKGEAPHPEIRKPTRRHMRREAGPPRETRANESIGE